jgi:hypothetical protein
MSGYEAVSETERGLAGEFDKLDERLRYSPAYRNGKSIGCDGHHN